MRISLFIPLRFARIPQPINTRTIRLNKPGLSINCLQALWNSLLTYKGFEAGGLHKAGCNFILMHSILTPPVT